MGVLDRLMSGVYVRWAYHPSPVPVPPPGLPVEHHLASVPWIVEDKPVCQSVAVKMIAASYGAHRSRAEIDFLMGFTYGAGYRPDWGYLTVGVDPETGIATAAPYLGLAALYQTTNDTNHYLAGLRAALARGDPVRVPLDMGTLYGSGEPLPHNEVLVGYDPGGFFYYEPISLPPSPCPPGRHSPGQQGLYVENPRLLDAVRRQAEIFGYPWRYALVSFAPAPVRTDLTPIWRMNGQALVGGSRWGQRWGAAATEYVAALIDDTKAPIGLAEKGALLGLATRPDNATYLRQAHPRLGEAMHAADDFDRAAAAYQATHAILVTERNSINAHHEVAQHLRDAAAAERRAGQRLLRCANTAPDAPSARAPA